MQHAVDIEQPPAHGRQSISPMANRFCLSHACQTPLPCAAAGPASNQELCSEATSSGVQRQGASVIPRARGISPYRRIHFRTTRSFARGLRMTPSPCPCNDTTCALRVSSRCRENTLTPYETGVAVGAPTDAPPSPQPSGVAHMPGPPGAFGAFIWLWQQTSPSEQEFSTPAVHSQPTPEQGGAPQ